MKILFVCTGNICRSPTAERLAIAYGARSHLQDFTASSAGTHALTGHPMEPNAAQILEKLGGDASDFAARQLSPTIAADADLVLTMTGKHRDHVLKLVPQQLHKTFTLREAARLISECNARSVADLAAFRPRLRHHGQPDVPDPMGHDEVFFAMIGAQIADLLPPILELCQRS
ncbi:low molecular weight phosphatase family protein [Mycobacterium sp. AZCC_0083]|uniref:arsenate reductase/protein-tyrosine-phosphatase family protein n=1 Tax=Mycobacterium sp. AZCC_0083 TaxID=2735882 RepID=UPI001619E75B|nr:low molecular weight phosphatase family protein [Mycobacterium sp. AZCC_0083]MBB5164245.1 protein-tyrosine phosphatase [Mycobacterium sp. AZCC_0083]